MDASRSIAQILVGSVVTIPFVVAVVARVMVGAAYRPTGLLLASSVIDAPLLAVAGLLPDAT